MSKNTETIEEQAARRIDAGADLWAERNDMFVKTLRSNARTLTPYKRQIIAGWVKRHCERLLTTLEEGEAIPPLGLDDMPDMDGGSR